LGKHEWRIRPATEEDVPRLMVLIKRLAEYERLMDIYTATEERYRRYGFGEDAIFKALRAQAD
jgi:S-adenosylmethionine:tRNA-ribosyltransferase-isomerase (queuine synthetase)